MGLSKSGGELFVILIGIAQAAVNRGIGSNWALLLSKVGIQKLPSASVTGLKIEMSPKAL